MIKSTLPNKYQLSKKVTKPDLLDYGFKQWGKDFHYELYVYKDIIRIEIDVFWEEQEFRYKIWRRKIGYYEPFYNIDYKQKNPLRDYIIYRFNKLMDDLCDHNIMWRFGYFPKKKKRRHKCFG